MRFDNMHEHMMGDSLHPGVQLLLRLGAGVGFVHEGVGLSGLMVIGR